MKIVGWDNQSYRTLRFSWEGIVEEALKGVGISIDDIFKWVSGEVLTWFDM